MKKFLLSSLLSFSILGFGALKSEARNYYYKVSEKESKINFHLVSTLHSVDGKVNKFRGHINVKSPDGKSIESVSGELEIMAKTLFTNQYQRDTRMKSEILSVSEYPLITFKFNDFKVTSNKLEKENTIYLHLLGDLTIRDTTKKVDIPMKIKLSADKKTAEVEGRYIINFKSYNVPDPSLPIIGNVDENINISFQLNSY